MKEIWIDIVEYEWKYQVSNKGNIKSLIKNRYLKTYGQDGYKRVNLNWKCYLVHRLVYMSFNNLPLMFKWQNTKTLVLHKNDNRDDNRLENLFLWNQTDNMRDMLKKWRRRTWKTMKIKIWYSDIDEIKCLYNKWKTIYEIGDIYWVSYATISRVINNKIWIK